MSDPFGDQPFPRGTLLAASALVGVVILAAVAGRMTGIGVVTTPAQVAAEARDLRFADRADGAVVVYEARSGAVVEVLAPGTNGFVRGVLRGLARERRSLDIGPEPAFTLARSRAGTLSLTDQATGRRISLDAFGPTNAGAFARLLGAAAPVATGTAQHANDEKGG